MIYYSHVTFIWLPRDYSLLFMLFMNNYSILLKFFKLLVTYILFKLFMNIHE
jgi:hypothetical protein